MFRVKLTLPPEVLETLLERRQDGRPRRRLRQAVEQDAQWPQRLAVKLPQ